MTRAIQLSSVVNRERDLDAARLRLTCGGSLGRAPCQAPPRERGKGLERRGQAAGHGRPPPVGSSKTASDACGEAVTHASHSGIDMEPIGPTLEGSRSKHHSNTMPNPHTSAALWCKWCGSPRNISGGVITGVPT